MRILTVCGDLGIGGTQRVAQNFTLAYARAGHAVAALADTGGVRAEILRAQGVPVFLTEAGREQALRAVDEFDPQLIQIHRPGIASRADTDLLRRLRRAPHRRVIETNVFARVDYSEGADLIDVHTQLGVWNMWKWRTALGRESARRAGVVLPYPVERRDFARAGAGAIAEFRARHGIPAGAFVCGRVGQPHPSKWHASTVSAFDRLAGRDPGAHLVLVGPPPRIRAAVESLPADRRARVRLLEPITDGRELCTAYSAMDCFVHAALIGESFGMVLAESMLCGCPVVTASRPDRDNTQLEVVGHNVGGLVAASTRWLPEAVERMWAGPAERARMAAAGAERVAARFDADLIAAGAVRIGEVAIASKDRRELIDRLGAEPDLQTDVSDVEIHALLRDTLGRPSPVELFRKRVVHVPLVQRSMQTVNRWRSGA